MLVYGYGNTNVKSFTESPPAPIAADKLHERVACQCTRILDATGLADLEAFGDGYVLFDEGLEFFAAWSTSNAFVAYSWDSTA